MSKEVIKALEAKIEEYELLLGEFLQKPSSLGRIISGPLKEGGVENYRVQMGADTKILKFIKPLVFEKNGGILKEGSEVICIGPAIVGVVPELLAPKAEKIEFKKIGWEEVGGLSSQISQIREAIDTMLMDKKTREEFGLEPMKGMLLYGPPGCGKTLIGRVIASEMLKGRHTTEDVFTYLKGGELLQPLVGAAENSIKGFFKRSRDYYRKTGDRAVIFLDEAEAILPIRGSRSSSDVDRTIVPTFLAEMDGLEDGNPFVILSSNLPNDIDPAILREGRIDLKVRVTRPTREDAKEIFKIHLSKVKLASSIEELVELGTEKAFERVPDRVSGALIQTVVKSAANKAVVRKRTAGKKDTLGIIPEDIASSIIQL